MDLSVDQPASHLSMKLNTLGPYLQQKGIIQMSLIIDNARKKNE